MTLELFFITGINSTDTMYFENEEKQKQYFENHNSRILLNDFSFYPPHYKNTITLTNNDVDFKSKINYLRLTYNDKYYYYFIRNIIYVSEDVVKLEIEMDVVQTYMFNIKFNYAHIDRRLINRRTGLNIINRNYIRENFSTNDFILKNYESIEDLCFIDVVSSNTIFNLSKEVNDSISNFEKSNTFANFNTYNKNGFSDGLVHYYIPYSKNKKIKLSGGGQILIRQNKQFVLSQLYTYKETSFTGSEIMNLVYLFAENPSVVAINFIPFNFLDYSDIVITKTTNEYIINVPSSSKMIITNVITHIGTNDSDLRYNICLGFPTFAFSSSAVSTYPFQLERIPYTYDLNSIVKITQNTERLKPYKVDYLPQLLDSNYRKIEYGERISYNTFPLEEIDVLPNFTIDCFYLLESGKRGYKAIAHTRYPQTSEDPYFTTFVVSSKENFTLKNDAWKSYIAQNKATLTTGLAYKYLQGALKGGSQILKGGAQFVQDYSLSDLSSAVGGITTTLNPYIEYKVNKENLEYTPDTITQGNNVADNYMLNSNTIMFRDSIVRDYERVAEIYTKIGFKVSEHYSNVNIIDELNTRYYYNYIKCGDLSISLDVINDDATLNKIIERFRDGLRFWNIEDCNTDQLEMGDLFKYDNVEKIFLN